MSLNIKKKLIFLKKLRHYFVEGGEGLFSRFMSGIFWAMVLRLSGKALSFIRIIFLARLLVPNDFGVLGIALLVASILGTFLRTGMDAALVRNKKDINSYLNTVWTIHVFRGIFLFACVFSIAPYAAVFFNEVNAVNVIRIFSFTLIFNGFKNVGTIYFSKNLEFRKQFAFVFLPLLFETIITIIAAFVLKNVWALLIGSLFSAVSKMIFSYTVHEYRPKLEFNKAKFVELFSYGKWLTGSAIVSFLLIQGDDILVGKILGATALGFYQMGYHLSCLPTTEITDIISQVSFPAFSKMQDDIKRLGESYLKILRMVCLCTIPFAGLIFYFANDFTVLFLGNKWGPVIPVIQILALWGAIRAIGSCTGPLFQAIGRPDLITKLQLVRLIIIIPVIYPFTIKYGIIGTSLVITGAALITEPLCHILSIKHLHIRVKEFLSLVFIPVAAAFCSMASLHLFEKIFYLPITILSMAIKICMMVLFYCLIVLICDNFLGNKFRGMIANMFIRIKNGA